MRKILITGYMHSGTTLLMQLLRAHPQVGWIEFEENYIEFDKPRKWVMEMASKRVLDLKKFAWGEKIPWGNHEGDEDAGRAISFSKKWLRFFGKDARILHISRHPLDAAMSGGGPHEKTLENILKSVPKYMKAFRNENRFATILYEDLVMEPRKRLKSIFKFLNLNYNDKIIEKVIHCDLKFGKINSDRAYANVLGRPEVMINYNKVLRYGRSIL